MWEPFAQLLGIVMPLVVVPLTVMIFYLRAVREHQTVKHREIGRMMESCRREMSELRRTVSLIERDFTTKEEWLRESMLARQTMERLTENLARAQAEIEHARAGTAGAKYGRPRCDRVVEAMTALASRLAFNASNPPGSDRGRIESSAEDREG